MQLNEYESHAKTTAIYPDAGSGSMNEMMYLALGLAGEAGEVANIVKKIYRDVNGATGYTQIKKIKDELGDVMWYWIMLCNTLGVNPEQILEDNLNKLQLRFLNGTIGGSGDNR